MLTIQEDMFDIQSVAGDQLVLEADVSNKQKENDREVCHYKSKED